MVTRSQAFAPGVVVLGPYGHPGARRRLGECVKSQPVHGKNAGRMSALRGDFRDGGDESLGVGVLGRTEDLIGGAGFHEFSRLHH
jgi:hypothetical protein